ncbi:MAG: class I tRNA ligase family protein, partial [Alphaproteobacteria bacterium]|nr:class I tRNA ligase family protein [Alphaproteobacteria bacterium]
NDGNFSHQAVVKRMNSELANDLGNLVQRVLVQVSKNCVQKVPEKGTLLPQDSVLIEKAYKTLDHTRHEFWHWGFHKALDQIWEVIGDANRYIDEQAPWGLKKTDLKRMETVLYTLCETIRVVGLLVQPFIPKTANQILDLVNVKSEHRDFAHILKALVSGVDLPQPNVLFPRFVEEAA